MLGTFRIREYFVRLDPEAAPFFPPADAEGVKKLERMGLLPTSQKQMLLTVAGMIGCIHAIVGGVTVAMGVALLFQAPVAAPAPIGGAPAVAFAVLFFVYQSRRFRRAAAVIPELYAWNSLYLFGAAKP